MDFMDLHYYLQLLQFVFKIFKYIILFISIYYKEVTLLALFVNFLYVTK